MRYGEQLGYRPYEYTWLARTEGAMARTTIFLLYALHEDRCLSTQEGESRDLRVLILMAGTVLQLLSSATQK